MSCENCYQDYIGSCIQSLTVYAKLEPETMYKIKIADTRFDRVFEQEVESDFYGFLVLDLASLPDGLFSAFSGSFRITVHLADDECSQVRFKLLKEYDCLEFTVKNGSTKSSLGCEY